MLHFLNPDSQKLQPDPDYMYKGHHEYDVDMRRQAAIIGSIALGLPFLIALLSSLSPGSLYDSLSHSYYGSYTGGVFVIALAFVGSFLIAYRGANWLENRLATGAGIAALLTAYFPTSGPGIESESIRQGQVFFTNMNCKLHADGTVETCTPKQTNFFLLADESSVHYIAAACLFAFLFYYAAFVFTRELRDKAGNFLQGGRAKRTRNLIYRTCAGVILVSATLLLAKMVTLKAGWLTAAFWDSWNATYWFESAALIAFGFSWMVKGRFFFGYLADDGEPLSLEKQAVERSSQPT